MKFLCLNKENEYGLCRYNCNLTSESCSIKVNLKEVVHIKLQIVIGQKNLGIFLYKKNNKIYKRNISIISLKKEEIIYENGSRIK